MSHVKTSQKRSSAQSKNVKANTPKKNVDESSLLQKNFVSSLEQLDKFWQKQVKANEKSLASQKQKLQKAQDKLKALKAKKAETSKSAKGVKSTAKLQKLKADIYAQQETTDALKSVVSQMRAKVQEAKQQVKKYNGLKKAVENAEKELAENGSQTTTKAKTAKKAKTAVATQKPATAKKAKTTAVAKKPAKAKTKPTKGKVKVKAKSNSKKPAKAITTEVPTSDSSHNGLDTSITETVNAALELN